jgi:hypothetical protein
VPLVEPFERRFDACIPGRNLVQLLEVANRALGIAREILRSHRRFAQKLELLRFFEPGSEARIVQ